MHMRDQSNDAAKEIYQDLLERISTSYWDDDFEAFAQMLRVPHKVSSFGPAVPIETSKDLRRLFDTMRAYLLKRGVTDYHRVCLAAQFNGPDEIVGMHETRILVGAHVVEDPYPVKSVLRRIDGVWWVCESDNAFQSDRGVGQAFHQRVARNASLETKDSGPSADQNERNFSHD